MSLPRSFPALLLALGGCGTVELGAPPADVNACRPSQQFLVNEVWPKFLDKEYATPSGNRRCSDGRCHDRGSARQLVLARPTSPAGDPLTGDWAAIYKSVTEQIQCTNVRSSTLLTRPSGQQTHGGGKLIEPDGEEVMIVQAWMTAP